MKARAENGEFEFNVEQHLHSSEYEESNNDMALLDVYLTSEHNVVIVAGSRVAVIHASKIKQIQQNSSKFFVMKWFLPCNVQAYINNIIMNLLWYRSTSAIKNVIINTICEVYGFESEQYVKV